MNLTAQVKLEPDADQALSLTRTMQLFNDACNFVAKLAFKRKVYHPVALHNLKISDSTLYYHLRATYPKLNSIQIELVFRKVADAYKTRLKRLKKRKKLKHPCRFKEMSSIPYNHLISNYKLIVASAGDRAITPHLSVVLVDDARYKRSKIDYIVADHQRKILANAVPGTFGGESRISFRKGAFYINIPVEQCVAPEAIDPIRSIGVDLGVVNIATTSYGKIFSGELIENKRLKFQKHRSSLQKCGSKSAKRRLKSVAGKEARFRKDLNHCISKELVVAAKGTSSRIVLEDLTNIREQTTVRKQQRARHHGWSFAQLREFIGYKAAMAQVEVKVVDPSYTSQRCNNCGSISRSNRRNQFRFSCKSCGHDAHADYNAACNLAWLGDNGAERFVKDELMH
jgi:IS605 OrfB family transposase